MILGIVVTVAVGALFIALLTKDYLRQRRRRRAEAERVRALFDAWREADQTYFTTMRVLLSAKRDGASKGSIELLETVAERLWSEANAARASAMSGSANARREGAKGR